MYLLAVADTLSKFPYTLEELRQDNPLTSFPLVMTPEELAAWGVFAVEEAGPPEFNEQTESIEIGAPALVDGKWIRAWSVVAAAPEEVERRTIVQAGLIRTERNRLLTATDYSQLPDFSGGSHNHEAITAYRQALRGVPQQPGFPWSVDWPVPDLERP
jgi:hypothetical protein